MQEDRPAGGSGAVAGRAASIRQPDPCTGAFEAVAAMDRKAAAPDDATDPLPGDIGNGESSGVLDVTDVFETWPGETWRPAVAQAHGPSNGSIGGGPDLVQGGRIRFLSK